MKKMRRTVRARRWGKTLLTLALLCALALGMCSTAVARKQAEVVAPVTPKPVVTLQGNLVTENGKPTGFYELALCVQSGRTITDLTGVTGAAAGSVITEAAYNAYLEANPGQEGDFSVHYYPFRTATAAVHINAEVLTAVHWDLTEVKYETYADGVGYPAGVQSYPVGINTDAAVQGYTMSEKDAFPDITTPKFGSASGQAVALDVEGDARMTTVTGTAEDYDAENKSALITLSASAPDNYPIVLTQSTPLVVARFAYDLKRFPTTKVNAAAFAGTDRAKLNSVTGDLGDNGFWMGWDKTTSLEDANMVGKTPLTWLGESDSATPYDFTDSDELAARSQMSQTVWVHMGTDDPVYTTRQDTYFYYYLGAEAYAKDSDTPAGTVTVDNWGTVTDVENVAIPATVGAKVLTEGTKENPGTAPAGYTFFENLLRLQDQTLRVQLVNEPTFKKPTGGTGGVQVLFYDWDDTLIGATIVDPKGDVRAQVNAYVEESMVHPDLRTGDILANDLGGTLPDLTAVTPASHSTDPAERYKAIIDSDDREWTYRGKYPYTLGGPDSERRDEDNAEPGKEYPLTNKLDYTFYRHINTETTLEYQAANGKVTTDRYITTNSLSENADAALYPWVYGWAVVEDNSARNQTQWQVRRDAAKVPDVWTTFDVGELSNLDPSYDTMANPGAQAIPTTLPGAPVAGTTVGGGTGIETKYPAFIDATAATAPTDYAYQLSTAGDNGYLRFADFSAIENELTREGQNVLIVKAVYEPGAELQDAPYWITENPVYNKLNGLAASAGGAYSVELTLERANNLMDDGYIRGSKRTRSPAIRQDTTIDQKWISDELLGVNHDLDNASITTAKNRTETTYTKVDSDNGEEITFTLSLSARQNKVNYFLIETYGYNFVSGGQRSDTNYNQYGVAHVIDNYYYFGEDADQNDAYFDQAGVYYQAARYDVRDGTHGFVLYGTLNYLMQQATILNHGGITRTEFNENASYKTFQDANLRITANGQPEVPSLTTQTALRDAIIAAAAECENNHYGDSDFWDTELDCAQLTYHQLQHYLLGNGLMSRADADAAPIDWCHLHRACFKDEEAEKLPETWEELLAAARDADPETQNTIGKLTAGATGRIEEITSLRTNTAGGYFATGKDFQTQFVRAVGVLDGAGCPVTWTTVQYYLLNGSLPADETAADAIAMENYWWYDGSASRTTPNSLKALDAATNDYFADVTLKDGKVFHGGFTAKLAPVKTVFDANATAAENEAAAGWINMIRNLVKGYENYDNVYDDAGNVLGTDYGELDGTGATTKFATYEEFMAYWLDFQALARGIGLDVSHDQYWELLQYYVLKTEAGESVDAAELARLVDVLADSGDPDNPTLLETFNGYWWKDGMKRLVVSSVRTLLTAARQKLSGGDGGPFDRVSWSVLDTNAFNFYQHNGGAGAPYVPYEEADLDALKVSFLKAAANPDVKDWQSLQYYLLHESELDGGATMDSDVVFGESTYYWWRNGGTGTVVNIAGGGTLQDKLNLLMEAVLRADGYGDPKALDQLKAADGIFTILRLVKEDPTGDGTVYTKVDLAQNTVTKNGAADTLEDRDIKYTDADALLTDISGLFDRAKTEQGITDSHTAPSGINWDQFQHWILTDGNYIVPGGPGYSDAVQAHWWYDKDVWEVAVEEPDPEATEALWEPMNTFYEKNMTTAAATTLKKELTVAKLNDTYKLRMTDAGAIWTTAKLNPAKTIFVQFAKDAQADYYKDWDGDGSSEVRVTWAQLQVYLATSTASATTVTKAGDLLSPEDALDRILNTWKWTVEGSGGDKDFIPTWVTLPSGASLLSLEQIEVAEETPETDPAPDAEAIRAQIEAVEQAQEKLAQEQEKLEQELAALKEQLAQAEEVQEAQGPEETQQTEPQEPEETQQTEPQEPEETQQTEPQEPEETQQTEPQEETSVPAPATRPTQSVTPAEDPVETPAEPETPEEDAVTPTEEARPEAPAPGDYNERVEIPLGEEAAAARAELDFLPVTVGRKEWAVEW